MRVWGVSFAIDREKEGGVPEDDVGFGDGRIGLEEVDDGVRVGGGNGRD